MLASVTCSTTRSPACSAGAPPRPCACPRRAPHAAQPADDAAEATRLTLRPDRRCCATAGHRGERHHTGRDDRPCVRHTGPRRARELHRQLTREARAAQNRSMAPAGASGDRSETDVAGPRSITPAPPARMPASFGTRGALPTLIGPTGTMFDVPSAAFVRRNPSASVPKSGGEHPFTLERSRR